MSKRGNRGGSKHKLTAFQKEAVAAARRQQISHESTSTLAVDAAKYAECSDIEENETDHIIPRESVTTSQHLRLFPTSVEVEELKPVRRWQLDKKSGKLVETTEQNVRVAWRSDKTLLRRTKPDTFAPGGSGLPGGRKGIKRQTSHSKRIVSDPERPNYGDVVGPEVESI